jgi:hypothetical protein
MRVVYCDPEGALAEVRPARRGPTELVEVVGRHAQAGTEPLSWPTDWSRTNLQRFFANANLTHHSTNRATLAPIEYRLAPEWRALRCGWWRTVVPEAKSRKISGWSIHDFPENTA